MSEPVKIVVNRVVDAALVLATKAEVQRSHAVVLQKCSVVGAGTQRGNAQVGALANLFSLFRGFRFRDFVKLVAFPHAQFRFRIGDVARHVVAEFFERVRAFHLEVSAPVGV